MRLPVRSAIVAERTRVDRTRSHSLGWARVTPWRGHPDVAQLVPTEGRPPSRFDVEQAIERLRRSGNVSIVTSAMTTADALPFVDAGFEIRERLHLLEHTFIEPVARDKDEQFVYELVVDLSKLEPTVACHPDPGQRKKAKEMNQKLDRAYVGSCTGGKTSDFVEVALGRAP